MRDADAEASVEVVDVCGAAAARAEEEATYHPVRVNDAAANALHPFPSNYARTTKYTLVTFLPKNLFEQFHKLTNVRLSQPLIIYFLI